MVETAKYGRDRLNGLPTQSILFPEIAANAAQVLIEVASTLLSRQIQALADAFEKEGGFTERLYKIRQSRRREE